MPLRFRCPHCRRGLVAEDDVVGERKLCPSCGRMLEVPEWLPEEAPPPAPPPKCPRCGGEVGPTATLCHVCLTDLRTGRLLPWKTRLGMRVRRHWAVVGFAAVVLGLGIAGVVQVYRVRTQPVTHRYEPLVPRAVAADELAAQLLGAEDAAGRARALAALRGVEARVAPGVAAVLDASLAQPPSLVLQANQLAAIDVLARNATAQPDAEPRWADVLKRCERVPALRDAALRGRGVLRDRDALPALVDLWLAKLQRYLLLARVESLSAGEDGGLARGLAQRARQDLARTGDGLRALADDTNNLVFERLAERYWESWGWLGQGAGDGYAEAVFELARPVAETLTFRPEDVRRPRDVLRRVSERGSPAARAAAGLILQQSAPQYRSLLERIAQTLVDLLPECDAVDQQRLTWTIARLRGRLLGNAASTGPAFVTAADVRAAWNRPSTPAEPFVRDRYPLPPDPVYRATTRARQQEQELLAALHGDWPAVRPTLERWFRLGLGSTPRVRALLDPAQRTPRAPVLAAAFVIVAVRNDQAARPQLAIWSDAPDQEPAVRALARTALASLDVRAGRPGIRWPGGLELDDPAALDAGAPGWDLFGYIVVASGPTLRQRLEGDGGAALAPEIRARLVHAAERVAASGLLADTP